MNLRSRKAAAPPARNFRCAIYTRKSTEDGLEQEFNSLDAQRESGEAFIKSQAHEGWECLADRYDDGGFTGGNMERPALRRMMADIEAGKIDCVVVYKVDRLSRSLLDFARMMETFDQHRVSFVSVTQQFNTASSMGRLILNVLLSFAQFEREMISERTRDKIAATRRKGKWSGGMPLLGYDVVNSKLVVVPEESERVRKIFQMYAEGEGLTWLAGELERLGWRNKRWTTRKGTSRGGRAFDKTSLHGLLTNVAYLGQVKYKDEVHPGEHQPIISEELWQQVQRKFEFQRRTGGAAVRNKFGAILKGLLHCTTCGRAMSPTHTTRHVNKRYRYYVCNTAQKQGRTRCPSGSVPAGEIERFVVEQIRSIGSDPQLVAETVRQVASITDDRLEELAAEEQRVRDEMASNHAELRRMIVERAVGVQTESIVRRLADCQERLAIAERRLVDLEAESDRLQRERLDDTVVCHALADFESVWRALGMGEQGRLLRMLLERIDYDGQAGEISLTFQASGLRAFGNGNLQGAAT